jgi:hypothetical protein
MNNKIIAVIVVLLLVVGVGGYVLMKKAPSQMGVPQLGQSQTSAPQASSGTTQSTLRSLLAGGGSVKCSFTNTASGTNGETGTIYVSGGKMRGDFQTTENGTVMGSHMINDSQYTYTWNDQSKQGYKFAIPSPQPAASSTTTEPSSTPTSTNSTSGQGPNMDQPMNYSCQAWATDTSVFTPPADVTFSSFTMQNLPTGAGSAAPSAGTNANGTNASGAPAMSPSAECGLCQNYPAGAQRNACLTQLHCQ